MTTSNDTAAEQISRLSQTALDIQKGLMTVGHIVHGLSRHLDVGSIEQVISSVDTDFNDMFEKSRESATLLQVHIESFLNQAVPIAAQTDASFDTRRQMVTSIVCSISDAADLKEKVFDDIASDLTSKLANVLQVIQNAQQRYRIASQEILDYADDNIDSLEAYIAANGTLMARISGFKDRLFSGFTSKPAAATKVPLKQPVIPPEYQGSFKPLAAILVSIKKLSDFITGGEALTAANEQLQNSLIQLKYLKENVSTHRNDIEKAVQEVITLSVQLDELDKYSVAFKGAWSKIREDASALKTKVSNEAKDDKELKNVVEIEVEDYRKLHNALDEYALGV